MCVFSIWVKGTEQSSKERQHGRTRWPGTLVDEIRSGISGGRTRDAIEFCLTHLRHIFKGLRESTVSSWYQRGKVDKCKAAQQLAATQAIHDAQVKSLHTPFEMNCCAAGQTQAWAQTITAAWCASTVQEPIRPVSCSRPVGGRSHEPWRPASCTKMQRGRRVRRRTCTRHGRPPHRPRHRLGCSSCVVSVVLMACVAEGRAQQGEAPRNLLHLVVVLNSVSTWSVLMPCVARRTRPHSPAPCPRQRSRRSPRRRCLRCS